MELPRFAVIPEAIVDAPDRNWLEPKLRAVALIQLRIGERKIGLVVNDRSAERESQLIVRNARNGIAHEYETEDLRGLFGASRPFAPLFRLFPLPWASASPGARGLCGGGDSTSAFCFRIGRQFLGDSLKLDLQILLVLGEVIVESQNRHIVYPRERVSSGSHFLVIVIPVVFYRSEKIQQLLGVSPLDELLESGIYRVFLRLVSADFKSLLEKCVVNCEAASHP